MKKTGKKIRLDMLLVERNLTDSRNRAQALIMAGKVRVNDQVLTKSGTLVNPEANITLEISDEWASRGAKKLLKAFDCFDINVDGKICADFGASTGGFTDVLLRNGAAKVYAIDVGYGQLIWRLAIDPRVVIMDRTNARYLTRENFPDEIYFATCDVSFISLKLIIPVIDAILNNDSGEAVVLIKPQFEAGRKKISHGVIKDRNIHTEVLENVCEFITSDSQLKISGLTHSPIRGPEGNIEFLCWLTRNESRKPTHEDISEIVNQAHES